MNPKTNLDYVTSKLDYKNKGEIIDLYTLRVRRSVDQTRPEALDAALEYIHNHVNEVPNNANS